MARKIPIVYVTLSDDNSAKDREEVIRNFDDLSNLVGRLTRKAGLDLDQIKIVCASSLDVADEFATDPDVIRLAKELRS